MLSQRLRAFFGQQELTKVSAEHVNDYLESDVTQNAYPALERYFV
jgi:hypothetical protein